MTAQVAESLSLEGRTLPLLSNPLTPYLEQHGKSQMFSMITTANRRGYVGHWEIASDRLYLVRFEGRLSDGSAANLATLFPDAPERIFAEWYSGTLRLPEGELIEYVHVGYGRRYERDRLITVRDGLVVETSIRHNEPAEPRTAVQSAVNRNLPQIGRWSAAKSISIGRSRSSEGLVSINRQLEATFDRAYSEGLMSMHGEG